MHQLSFLNYNINFLSVCGAPQRKESKEEGKKGKEKKRKEGWNEGEEGMKRKRGGNPKYTSFLTVEPQKKKEEDEEEKCL